MLLGFSGRLGSGKDTAGARLAELVEQQGIHLSFARPLKESAAALLDIDPADWEIYKNDPDVQIHLAVGYREHEVEDNDPRSYRSTWLEEPNVIRTFTAREFLQRYGTESHRDIFGPDFWVEQAMKDYYPTIDHFHYFTDVRFVNEAEAIIKRGGMIVRVIGANEETGDHASEIGLPSGYANLIIDNSQRGDNFVNLDRQLLSLAINIGLTPYRSRVFTLTGAA